MYQDLINYEVMGIDSSNHIVNCRRNNGYYNSVRI